MSDQTPDTEFPSDHTPLPNPSEPYASAAVVTPSSPPLPSSALVLVEEPQKTKKQKNPRKRMEPEEWLPQGWTVERKVRANGKFAGSVDKLYFNPEGLQFRSRKEVQHYVETGRRRTSIQKRNTEIRDNVSLGPESTPLSNPSLITYNSDAVLTTPSPSVPAPALTVEEAESTPMSEPQKKRRKLGDTDGEPERCETVTKTQSVRKTARLKAKGKKQHKKMEPEEWLPEGWSVERKIRSSGKYAGSTDKLYFNPEGFQFRSTKEVQHYLETGKHRGRASMRKDNTESPNKISLDPVSTRLHNVSPIPYNSDATLTPSPLSSLPAPALPGEETESTRVLEPLKIQCNKGEGEELPEWLPEGWLAETKTRSVGKPLGLKYTLYINPDGLQFRSKKEVEHYVQTGKGGRRASIIKPNTETSSLFDPESTQLYNPSPTCYNSDAVLTLPPISSVPATALAAGETGSTPVSEPPKKWHKNRDPEEHPEWLPEGWWVEAKIRTVGKTAGLIDKSYYNPEGHLFRSKKDVQHYLATGMRRASNKKPKGKQTKADAVLVESSASSCLDAHNQAEEVTRNDNPIPHPDPVIEKCDPLEGECKVQ